MPFMELNIEEQTALKLMIQGTHSDAGKSMLVTALCRIFRQDGYQTAPFKSQNMALNSYITSDGKEIGRAQGIQAEAARIEATTDMNPILIKPSKDMESQVVFHGKPYANMRAAEYREDFYHLGLQAIKDSLIKLSNEYEVIVLEGAGSPAEVNLNDRELVNMKVAAIAEAPVILIGDIDKGGVFASLVGTLQLLSEANRNRIIGVIINKFRGDLSLLQPGLDWFEQYTGLPVLGVVPFLPDLEIDAEDSLVLSQYSNGTNHDAELDVAVLSYPRLSNFTDIDPLRLEPDVNIRFVKKAAHFGNPDLIILPGTKNTAEDLLFLKQTKLDNKIISAYEKGTQLAGICGGFQMLGEKVLDPNGVESDHQELTGLGIFPVCTTIFSEKKTIRTEGYCSLKDFKKISLSGYEIHMGQSESTQKVDSFSVLSGTEEGCTARDGQVFGTYLHDVFHNDEFRGIYLNKLRQKKGLKPIERSLRFRSFKESEYDRLAAHVRGSVDMKKIYESMKTFYLKEVKQND
ncbi:cobyric acid synthase [Metabacillus idriensis]|uniref:cobyric acid synthase n=1 Tax=Metabacillus idriensis TaxID=324768 RepID=UPI00281471FB|nr:cobyric acid synthase [Metabacillus idriensis]MDR0137521.1 cobyric acid synthase [Metabacillus idriensis]